MTGASHLMLPSREDGRRSDKHQAEAAECRTSSTKSVRSVRKAESCFSLHGANRGQEADTVLLAADGKPRPPTPLNTLKNRHLATQLGAFLLPRLLAPGLHTQASVGPNFSPCKRVRVACVLILQPPPHNTTTARPLVESQPPLTTTTHASPTPLYMVVLTTTPTAGSFSACITTP